MRYSNSERVASVRPGDQTRRSQVGAEEKHEEEKRKIKIGVFRHFHFGGLGYFDIGVDMWRLAQWGDRCRISSVSPGFTLYII